MAYAISTWNITSDTWEHEVGNMKLSNLIKDGTTIKTINGGVLSAINMTSLLTVEDYKEKGFKDMNELIATNIHKKEDMNFNYPSSERFLYSTKIDRSIHPSIRKVNTYIEEGE